MSLISHDMVPSVVRLYLTFLYWIEKKPFEPHSVISLIEECFQISHLRNNTFFAPALQGKHGKPRVNMGGAPVR